MDIEFHYYLTYLIAVKAGLPPADARVLAHASQYVDDNDRIFEIDRDQATCFRNYISQTMNILKPKASLLRIYPLFHFIPGDPQAETAWRKDGKMHWLATTPDSENARQILDAAIGSGSLFRIGIAAHSYVDTWAHQNFVGYYDSFNAMKGPLERCSPDIGHADAGHHPDWPALVWKDARLLHEAVDNRARFLDAAAHLLARLARFASPGITAAQIAPRQAELCRDLDEAIGPRDDDNRDRQARIARYRLLAQTDSYGATALPEYDEHLWFGQAVNTQVRGLRDSTDGVLGQIGPLLADLHTWKNRDTYQQTEWFRFQRAVIDHQNTAWDILANRNFRGLQLPEL